MFIKKKPTVENPGRTAKWLNLCHRFFMGRKQNFNAEKKEKKKRERGQRRTGRTAATHRVTLSALDVKRTVLTGRRAVGAVGFGVAGVGVA